MKSYDVVIIGAGLSGLAAGIRLAYYDRSVCIFEQHDKVGGLNSYYRRYGRDFDVGLHAVTNWTRPDVRSAPLNKLLRQLRLRWDDFQLAPQEQSAIIFPQHTLCFSNEFEQLVAEVRSHFPDSVTAFCKAADRLRELSEQPPGSLGSARQWLQACLPSAQLVEMLLCAVLFYGSPTARDLDLFDFAVLFRSIFLEGLGRPPGGIRRILSKLTEQLERVGGELRLRKRVSRILHRNGQVGGVELADGEQVTAKAVVSCAGLEETLQLCGDQWNEEKKTTERLSFVESIFCLKKKPKEYGLRDSVVFFNDAEEALYERPSEPVELRSGVVCCPDNFLYPEPSDYRQVRVTAAANPQFWFSLEPERYKEEKARWQNMLLQRVERLTGCELKDEVVCSDFFTPKTIHRFTGHLDGAVYGSARKQRDGTTPLKNLYVCGTDQGYLGIVGSMLSGITVVNTHLLR